MHKIPGGRGREKALGFQRRSCTGLGGNGKNSPTFCISKPHDGSTSLDNRIKPKTVIGSFRRCHPLPTTDFLPNDV